MVKESIGSNTSTSYYEYDEEIRELLVDVLYPNWPKKQHIKKYIEKKIGDIVIATPPEKILPILGSFSEKSYGFLETGLSTDFLENLVDQYSVHIRDNKDFINIYNIQQAIQSGSRTGISWRKGGKHDFFTERYEFQYCGDDYKTINEMYKNASPEVRKFLRGCKHVYIHCMLAYYAFIEGYKILINQAFRNDEEKKKEHLTLANKLLSENRKGRLSLWDYRVPENEVVIAQGHTDSSLFNMILYEDSQGIQTKNINTVQKKGDIEDKTGYQYVTIPDQSSIIIGGRSLFDYKTLGLCPTPHRVENQKNTRLSIGFSLVEKEYFSEIKTRYKDIYKLPNNDTSSHSE